MTVIFRTTPLRLKLGGNEPYSTETTEHLLELLTEIAPLKDGAEFDFCGEDQTYWRFIFENGKWKEQSGKIVYHD